MANAIDTIPAAMLNHGLRLRPSLGSRTTPVRYSPSKAKSITQIVRNVSRLNRPHPYAMSATERNFSAKASSRTPNVTFRIFIHAPDLGAFLSIAGKSAKMVNGNAKATANPAMPIAGAA